MQEKSGLSAIEKKLENESAAAPSCGEIDWAHILIGRTAAALCADAETLLSFLYLKLWKEGYGKRNAAKMLNVVMNNAILGAEEVVKEVEEGYEKRRED